MTGGFQREWYDAIVVGAGPNGLAAAITLAGSGRSVVVIEAQGTVGGGLRSGALTEPGCVHDVCSAIHPMVRVSPFFRGLGLEATGEVAMVEPPGLFAHPLEDGTAVVAERSVAATATALGMDGAIYRRLMEPFIPEGEALMADALQPAFRWPRDPLRMARLGMRVGRSAVGFAGQFRGVRARAMFAGLAGHAVLPFDRPLTAAAGFMLGLAGHLGGWPFPRGGAQRLADAMASRFRGMGGEVVTGCRVTSLSELPRHGVVVFDTIPRRMREICGEHLPPGLRRRADQFRHGPGVFKVDWVLDGPVPWKAVACARSATVHLGGTFEEIAAAEAAPWAGRVAERPFVLLAQPSLFDPTRAPAGRHVVWAYCHVPAGCGVDMTSRIEGQIERFAPGFRDRIVAKAVMSPEALERYNANYVGGDITGGVFDMEQMLRRPRLGLVPYRMVAGGLYLCSSSTPPGPGVHGMCGWHAAMAVLRDTGG